MKKIIIILMIFCLNININAQIVELDNCVDGDTARLITEKGIENTRFLAIDTPELRPVEPFAKEAASFTCNELKNANIIRLELDENSDMYDRYDRLLAWVFVDDVLLQEKIIEQGLGKVAYLYGDYKYTEILKLKESQAKLKGIGIWQEESDFEVFSIGVSAIAFMSIVNLFYFNFKKSRRSYINKIYMKKNIYLRTSFIIIYIITVIAVVHDFGIVAQELAKYRKKLEVLR